MNRAFQLKQPSNTKRQSLEHEERESFRINKYLTASGFCSRREADRLVDERRVTIDGQLAVQGSKVFPGQTVQVDRQRIAAAQAHVYIALNKPIGITCTVDQAIDGNIVDFMDYPYHRIFPIGRLDKDSSGLILLTSDGDIVNKILRAENNHEKEYIVEVSDEIHPSFIKKMSAGVEITNMRSKAREFTKRCVVQQLTPRTFKIILTQGLNRQIRRMCSELGYRVTVLRRIRIMNIHLGNLKVGQWRYLTQEELNTLSKSF
ncbi:MAG: pseudouridine synthase [Clostridiales bacterium]|nr:pseudouridine synthase [Clostridiales bacterium]